MLAFQITDNKDLAYEVLNKLIIPWRQKTLNSDSKLWIPLNSIPLDAILLDLLLVDLILVDLILLDSTF